MQKLFEIRIKFFLHNEKFNAVEYRQMDRQIEKQIDRQREREGDKEREKGKKGERESERTARIIHVSQLSQDRK